MLRVPCIPFKRQRGFWRSSVRGSGPPASEHSAAGSQLPLCVVSHAAPPVSTLPRQLNPIALRVTRMNARTRCRVPVASRTTGGRVAASPPVGIAARAPEAIPLLVQAVKLIPVDDNSQIRDVSTTFWDVSKRPKRPANVQCSWSDGVGTCLVIPGP